MYQNLLPLWRTNEELMITAWEGLGFTNNYNLRRNSYVKGSRHYELSNHTSTLLSAGLGNVLTVVSDRKIEHDERYAFAQGGGYKYENGAYHLDASGSFAQLSASDGIISHYTAELISATDYYAFGAPLPGRTWQGGEYRFGFNGQERDDEVAGVGNIMTAEFWMYDGRLGRRWNVDPVNKYWISPFHAFSNKPIWNIDPNGADDDNYEIYENGNIKVQRTDDATNTYTYVNKDGTKKDLGTYEKTNGMVKLGEKNEFMFQALYSKGKNYLPGDAAAGALGAMYSYFKETGHVTKINQFMTSEMEHSKVKKRTTCIDVQYIGNGIAWAVQPDTRNGNVHKGKSEDLANKFRYYGFDGRGQWNVLSENANGSASYLSNSSFVPNHQNHFHVQTFRDSKIKVVKQLSGMNQGGGMSVSEAVMRSFNITKSILGSLFGNED